MSILTQRRFVPEALLALLVLSLAGTLDAQKLNIKQGLSQGAADDKSAPANAAAEAKPDSPKGPSADELVALLDKEQNNPNLSTQDKSFLTQVVGFAKRYQAGTAEQKKQIDGVRQQMLKLCDTQGADAKLSDEQRRVLGLMSQLLRAIAVPAGDGAKPANAPAPMDKAADKPATKDMASGEAKPQTKPSDKKAETAKNESGTMDSASPKGEPGKKIRWRTSYAEAMAEAASTGKAVWICFYADNDAQSRKLDAETFIHPDLVALINQQFIALRLDVRKNGEVVKEFKTPGPATAVVVRSTREKNDVIEMFRGFRDGPTYLADMKKVVTKIGELDPIEGPERLARQFEAGARALEEGKPGVAYAIFKQIASQEGSFIEVKNAKAKVAEIEAEGAHRLEDARKALAANDYVKAATLLTKLSAEFEGVPAAADADALAKQLSENPNAKESVRRAEAQTLFDQAKGDIKSEKFAMAINRLETIVSDFEDQPVAKQARWQLSQLKGNTYAMRKALDADAEAQCKVWLSLARTWKRNKRNARAQEYYRQIITTFPGTTFAQQAEREMAGLR